MIRGTSMSSLSGREESAPEDSIVKPYSVMIDNSDKEPICCSILPLLIFWGIKFGNAIISCLGGNFLNSAFLDLYAETMMTSLEISNLFRSTIICEISKIVWLISSPCLFRTSRWMEILSIISDFKFNSGVYFSVQVLTMFVDSRCQFLGVFIHISFLVCVVWCNFLIG